MISPLSGVSVETLKTPNVTGAAAQGAQGAGFAETFQAVAENARDTLKTSEATSLKGIAGEASVQDVVTAMMSAEQQLRAAIAVRDRVVAAYQEVSRMQI